MAAATQADSVCNSVTTERMDLDRCRMGDPLAFERIYNLHSGAVLRFAYGMLGNHEDALDVRQETFVKAFQALISFRGQCKLQTWLLQICANLCRDRFRKRSRRPEVTSEVAELELSFIRAGEASDPAVCAQKSLKIETVRKAMAMLPPAQREVLMLRDIEEHSVEEAMAIIGCSRVNLNVRLFRARQRLRGVYLSLMDEDCAK